MHARHDTGARAASRSRRPHLPRRCAAAAAPLNIIGTNRRTNAGPFHLANGAAAPTSTRRRNCASSRASRSDNNHGMLAAAEAERASGMSSSPHGRLRDQFRCSTLPIGRGWDGVVFSLPPRRSPPAIDEAQHGATHPAVNIASTATSDGQTRTQSSPMKASPMPRRARCGLRHAAGARRPDRPGAV